MRRGSFSWEDHHNKKRTRRAMMLLLFQLVIMLLCWPKIQCYKLELRLHRGTKVLCAPSSLPNFNAKVPIHVATSGMKLSSDLKKQIEEKVGSVLDKVGRNVFSAHVSLQTNNFRDNEHHSLAGKKGSQTVEVTVHLKGHKILHAKGRSDNMFGSIDKAAHKLMRLIVKRNQKAIDAQRKSIDIDITTENRGLNEMETDAIEEFETFYYSPPNTTSFVNDK